MARRRKRWQWLAPLLLVGSLTALALWTALDLLQEDEEPEPAAEEEETAPSKVAEPTLAATSEAPTTEPALAWEFCSGQGEVCDCAGRMRWGTPSKHTIFEAKAEPWSCDFQSLGDPAPGETAKICECEATTPRANVEWIYCASQYMLCDCPGRIRWGNKTLGCSHPKISPVFIQCFR